MIRAARRPLCQHASGLRLAPGPRVCPRRHKPHAVWRSRRLSSGRCSGKQPLVKPAGCGAVRVAVGGIDHPPLRPSGFSGTRRQNPVQHPHPAPAHNAVGKRLVRPLGARRILPLPAILAPIDDAADNPPVVAPRHAVRQRNIRRHPRPLARAQQNQATHHTPPAMETLNHASVNRS